MLRRHTNLLNTIESFADRKTLVLGEAMLDSYLHGTSDRLCQEAPVPVVDLYALMNPQHTPRTVPHRTLYHDVPCKYCYKSICPMGHHNCLQMVSPELVVDADLELLIKDMTHPKLKN